MIIVQKKEIRKYVKVKKNYSYVKKKHYIVIVLSSHFKIELLVIFIVGPAR